MKYTFQIEQDECPLNPRDEFDNLSTFYGPSNSRYSVGGKQDCTINYWQLEDYIKDFRKERAVIVEFQSNAGTCYSVIEESQLKKEYLDFGYSMRKAKYHARQCAKSEIETWLAYCEGEVYGYIVSSDEEEDIDSCWGYYGESGRKFAEDEAKSLIDWYIEQDKQNKEQEDGRKYMSLPVLAGE